MNFARFSVTRPVTVTMRIAALVLLGAICLTRLPVDLLPRVSLPTVGVMVQWPNVAPEEIEAQITRPIEQAVSSVPNLYEVSSSTTQGSAFVRVQLQWGTDVGQAAVDVQQLVQRASRSFPIDPTLQPPVVAKFDPSTLPILIYGISGIKDPIKLRTLLDNQVSPIIESADGVASASVTGGQQRAIIVDIDPERLRAFHLALPDVTRRISQENVNIPAGIAKQGNTEYTIRSLGWFRNIEELRRIPVGQANGAMIPLSAVADVRDQSQEVRLYTRLNGQPAVGLIITKQSEANTVDTSHAVQEKIDQVTKLYPQLKFGMAYNQSQFIENSVHQVTEAAIIGGVLAILILLFFLRNVRSTLVVALSIPTSIISTFALLYFCGFTLNTMSLGGLALATGLIVDDAVVVLENIFRHIERDKKRAPDAAISATMEIASAVVASTMTIVVVFLPLLLVKGQAGQMFTQFALVVMFSILVSLLDATTVVPMLASRLIKGDAHHEMVAGADERTWLESVFAKCGRLLDELDASYRRGLMWAIHNRAKVLGSAVALSLAGGLLLPFVGTELMPQADSGDFSVNIKMPVGTSLEKTNQAVEQIEQILLKDPDVATVFSAAGTTLNLRGTTTALRTHLGSATVKLKDSRHSSTLDVMQRLRKQFGRIAGARAMPNQFDIVTMLMTGGNQNVEVNIFGDDIGTLSRLSKDTLTALKDVSGLENVDVNWQEATPELQWEVDRQKALQLGLSFSDVAGAINTATNGTIASYYQEAGFQYPIVVQLPENRRKTVPEIMNIAIHPTIGSNRDKDIFLGQVAQPVYGFGPSEITRLNRQRYVAISGAPQGRSASDIQKDVETAMAKIHLPEGYRWNWSSTMKRRAEEFGGMGLAVFLGIALIYMLLASQFESFIHPLTVLTSVPLCSIGVILALFLTDRAFGLTAFIGLLMLVGIVVKNGILLVDYTNVLRSRGIPRDDAILTAGPTRLRPILMTALAAGCGMLPLAIGLGAGSEVQAPMATAVIGGLFSSTVLTLFVVPVVYLMFDDLGRKLSKQALDLAPSTLVEPSIEALGGDPDADQSPWPDAATPVEKDKI